MPNIPLPAGGARIAHGGGGFALGEADLQRVAGSKARARGAHMPIGPAHDAVAAAEDLGRIEVGEGSGECRDAAGAIRDAARGQGRQAPSEALDLATFACNVRQRPPKPWRVGGECHAAPREHAVITRRGIDRELHVIQE